VIETCNDRLSMKILKKLVDISIGAYLRFTIGRGGEYRDSLEKTSLSHRAFSPWMSSSLRLLGEMARYQLPPKLTPIGQARPLHIHDFTSLSLCVGLLAIDRYCSRKASRKPNTANFSICSPTNDKQYRPIHTRF
jgi:hypothetical protein